MKLKAVSGIMLTLLLTSILTLAFNIQPAEASGTIYISSDYTFTSNIYEPIVVTADNIIIDGAGHTVQGTGSGNGIDLSDRNNVTLKNVEVTNFEGGIYLSGSSNNNITGNTFSSNYYDGISIWSSSNNTVTGNNVSSNNNAGIYLFFSSNNNITGNTASNNEDGIFIGYGSHNNTVSGNTASNNTRGIYLQTSSNNALFHNNFINNTQQVDVSADSLDNVWDDGYPSGGNYWSNYTGVDLDHDGIGDTEHVIEANNTDNYPLMGMFSDFKATSEYHVQTICNSTISDFQYNGTAISFNVTGETETIGLCRILIPTALMNVTYKVYVNGTEVSYDLLPCSNSTHSYLYFTYNLSTQEVIIIPEFPAWTSILLILIMLTVAIAIYKRRKLKTSIQ